MGSSFSKKEVRGIISTAYLNNGDRLNLMRKVPGLKKIRIGCKWEKKNSFFGRKFYDSSINLTIICMDMKSCCQSVVGVNHEKKFYNAIEHYVKRFREKSDFSEEETIVINFEKIPQQIVKLVLMLNINGTMKHFGNVENCYVNVTDTESDFELVHYSLDIDKYKGQNGILVALLARDINNEWKFHAIGEGLRAKSIEGLFTK